MPIPPHLASFWSDFVKSNDGASEERFYEAFFFGDSEELANELAALVLRGTRRATAGAVWSYEAAVKGLLQPGDLSIVTTWSGQPLCIIETQSVEVVPFQEVTAEFAATEGEGHGSLSFWQEAHRACFTRECASAGREFTENMLVACERFAVVYRPQPVRPNPSFERTSTGKALGPRANQCHDPSRGPSASPAPAAQLKR